MATIVGIRFRHRHQIYNFKTDHFILNLGDIVMVNTEYGLELGTVVRGPQNFSEAIVFQKKNSIEETIIFKNKENDKKNNFLFLSNDIETTETGGVIFFYSKLKNNKLLHSIHRLATAEDLAQAETRVNLEHEAYTYFLKCINNHNLKMNLVKVECFFDLSKIIFYFTAEKRLDFRNLVKDLVAHFHTKIELRQISIRHKAKLVGGNGSCGREICCSLFLKEFTAVSVKMAKEQNLSLNPNKISGVCGRLMCCLAYEYESYQTLKKNLPKLGKKIMISPELEVKVVRQSILDQTITLLLPNGNEETIASDKILNLVEESQKILTDAHNKIDKKK